MKKFAYIFLVIAIFGCNRKKKLSDYIDFNVCQISDKIICRRDADANKYPSNEKLFLMLKDAVKTHNAYKYGNYCTIILINSSTGEQFNLRLIGGSLVKFRDSFFKMQPL